MALKSYTGDWGELHRLPDRVDGALYARTRRNGSLGCPPLLPARKEGDESGGRNSRGILSIFSQ